MPTPTTNGTLPPGVHIHHGHILTDPVYDNFPIQNYLISHGL
jgi:hypothetical protein